MDQTHNPQAAVTLGQYKGLHYTRRVRPVTDKMIEQELQIIARRYAVYQKTSAPAVRENRVTLDFAGFLGGQLIPDSSMNGLTVILGSGKLMPAAEQAICGHCAGEQFRFDFTYPDSFRVAELSGKTAQFAISLHEVEQLQIPAIDDTLAQRQGFCDLSALRDAVRCRKTQEHQRNADRIAGAALLNTAGQNLTAVLPEAELDRLAEQEIQQLKNRLLAGPLSLQDYCRVNHTTLRALRAGYRKKAEEQMRARLAVQAIAEAEHLVVTDAEADAEYDRVATKRGESIEQLRRTLTRDTIVNALLTRKVQDFLIDHAVLTSAVEKE